MRHERLPVPRAKFMKISLQNDDLQIAKVPEIRPEVDDIGWTRSLAQRIEMFDTDLIGYHNIKAELGGKAPDIYDAFDGGIVICFAYYA